MYLLCTLTESLFGSPPFASKTIEELEEKLLDTKPIEVSYSCFPVYLQVFSTATSRLKRQCNTSLGQSYQEWVERDDQWCRQMHYQLHWHNIHI